MVFFSIFNPHKCIKLYSIKEVFLPKKILKNYGKTPYLKLRFGDYSLFQVIFPLRILCISGFFLMLSTW